MQIPSHVASQLYTNAQSVTQAHPRNEGDGTSFADLAANFLDAMRAGEATTQAGLTGRADAQAVVEALAATEIAVQTAVTVRDKVVEAYQEILRMPV
ncbi:flagellar hook-basal body complex protein FliE [Algicella marina]|uniref:Flagellar hook-basal body complex protein FliE n=1 Tax=Algicella marina TaxID=2683284 RepID=A0A6P1T359_9RHOB|nr:flagellar hook-basal body complex protein FliE [Algicella marina]QHQ36447.1 flagellar hook-basal body complex protein FliE [Algicella marina]